MILRVILEFASKLPHSPEAVEVVEVEVWLLLKSRQLRQRLLLALRRVRSWWRRGLRLL